MQTPEQIIAERFNQLPLYVKQAIGESQSTTKMRTIGQRHKLRIDQQMVMEREVMLVMLGFSDEASFVRNLITEAKIPLADAQKLAVDIGNEIFVFIRAAMRRMAEEARAPKKPEEGSLARVQTPTPSQPQQQKESIPTKQAQPAASATPAQAPSAPNPPSPLVAVEKTLAEPVITPNVLIPVGPAPVAKPQEYKADPYREPIE